MTFLNSRRLAKWIPSAIVAAVLWGGTSAWSVPHIVFTDEFSGTDEQEGIIAYHAGTDALYGIGIQFTAIAGIDTPVVATPLSCFSCFLNFAISVTPTAAGFDFVPGGPINAFELVGDPGGIIPGEDILLTGTFLGSGDLDDTVGFTSASVGTDFKHPDIVERWFGPGAEPPPLNFIFLFTSQGFGPNLKFLGRMNPLTV